MTSVDEVVETPPVATAPAVGAIVLSTVVSAVVAFRHIATKPLWRDEAISVSVATRPVARILSVLPHHDANAGLYYLLLHGWLAVGGHGPAWARGFSACCFVATAALAAWAGGRWHGAGTGLACGLLVAVNPFLLYYGQEARPYALAVLLALVATVALFRLDHDPDDLLASRVFVAAGIVLIYADLFAALYLAALIGTIVVVRRRRRQALPPAFVRGLAIITAATAPLAVVMLVFERGQISWLGRPGFAVLTTTVTGMSSGWLGLAAIVALGVVALAASATGPRWRARARARAFGVNELLSSNGSLTPKGQTAPATVVIALAAAAALPPIGLWTLAQLQPVFIDRYVICSALAMIGLAAAGLAVLRERLGDAGRLLGLVALAVLVLLGGQRSAHLEAEPFKVDNGPAVVEFIRARAQPGDAVAYAGGGLRTLVEASFARAPGSFPTDVALAPGGAAFLQDDLYAREVSAAVLAARLDTVHRLWLITDPADQNYPQGGPFAQLRPFVTSRFGSPATTSFSTVDVTLLNREP